MNFEHILDNIKLEKLDENHDVGEFASNYEETDKFLKHEALELQDIKGYETFLIIYDGDILGYFTIRRQNCKIGDETYMVLIKSGIMPEDIMECVMMEIKKFAIGKKYEDKKLTLQLLGRIYGHIKLFLRSITTYEPIAVIINPDCNIPATKNEVLKALEIINKKLKHPKFINVKESLPKEFGMEGSLFKF